MSDSKDYTKLRLEELLNEQKELKKKERLSALIIGFLIGVMIFGVAANGFGFLYIFIPLILISWIIKDSQKQKEILKAVQQEIETRDKK